MGLISRLKQADKAGTLTGESAAKLVVVSSGLNVEIPVNHQQDIDGTYDVNGVVTVNGILHVAGYPT